MSIRTLALLGAVIGLVAAFAPATNASGFANGCSVATAPGPAPSVTTCTFLVCPANVIMGGTVTAVSGLGTVTITASCASTTSCTTDVPGNCRTTTVNTADSTGTCTLTVVGEGVTASGRCGIIAPAFPVGGPCPDQPIHTYGSGGSVGGRSATVTSGNDFGVGFVTVTDTNAADCDGDGVGGDWDGDLDAGVGGGAFGYGPWASDADCNYGLNVHGPGVAVNDVVFGSDIGFVVGEDDQGGPIKVQDPTDGSWTCTTDGSISPCPSTGCDPADPTQDPDDCLSVRYVGVGATCGTGGGDGLYWVFLDGVFVVEGAAEALGLGNNPPTSGTITAF